MLGTVLSTGGIAVNKTKFLPSWAYTLVEVDR